MSTKTKILATFLAYVVAFDASAQVAQKVSNRASNQDLCLAVTVGSTLTDGLCVNGPDAFIGIGTNAPARQLHTRTSGTAYNKLESTSATGYAGTEYTNADKTWTVGIEGPSDSFVITKSAGFGATSDYILEVDKTSNVAKFANGGVSFATTGGTPTTLDFFEEATVSTTFTQAGGYSQTVSIIYQRLGKRVTVQIPTFSSTTTATSAISSGATDIPSRFRPGIESRQFTPYGLAGSQTTNGGIYFTTGGQIQVYTSITGATFASGNASSGLGAGGTSANSWTYFTP